MPDSVTQLPIAISAEWAIHFSRGIRSIQCLERGWTYRRKADFGMPPPPMFGVSAVLAALAVMPIGGAAAAAPVACDMEAYLNNFDTFGTNIRSGPSNRASVILHAPGGLEAIATVTGFQDGWFRVEKLEQADSDHDHVFFENRRAWIHRSRLQIEVAAADSNLRRQPRAGSRTIRRLDGQERVFLLGCAGKWAHIRTGTETGWLSPAGQCANPLTTCP